MNQSSIFIKVMGLISIAMGINYEPNKVLMPTFVHTFSSFILTYKSTAHSNGEAQWQTGVWQSLETEERMQVM